MNKNNGSFQSVPVSGRRVFVQKGLMIALGGVVGAPLLAGCGGSPGGEDQKVSPPEDLMQEHGVLNRVLLIYDACREHLVNKTAFPRESLADAAQIIRTFIEDYHERQEENYLFPRFQKAHQLTDLVATLLQQHQAGRRVTEEILQITRSPRGTEAGNERLVTLINAFNTMYRPHEAREDTVLFPAFRKIVSHHEYDSLGETFEKNEHQLFGQDGFEKIVSQVAGIEKKLGIYELSQFTPRL